MTAWPETMKVAPIATWPGTLTRNRQHSRFRAPLADTLDLLAREIGCLTDTRTQRESAELLVAIPPTQFGTRGRPLARAQAEHPGVIFSIDSRHGHLSYPCDTFATWQDNLRAIAKALEALRMVDRYGVTKRGEQYRGFLAIEATAAPSGFTSAEAAIDFIENVAGYGPVSMSSVATVLRRAQREAHPDTGGDAATFQRVSLAEAKLREEGLL